MVKETPLAKFALTVKCCLHKRATKLSVPLDVVDAMKRTHLLSSWAFDLYEGTIGIGMSEEGSGQRKLQCNNVNVYIWL